MNAEASHQVEVNSRKRKRSIEFLRAKRLRRNKKKKRAYQNQTRQERLGRIAENVINHEARLQREREKALTTKLKKETRLSSFCWSKYKEQLALR